MRRRSEIRRGTASRCVKSDALYDYRIRPAICRSLHRPKTRVARMHFTPLGPVSVPHGGRLSRIYKLFVIACASVRRLAVAPPPQRADLAAGSASTAAAAERDWRGTCPPSTPSLQFTVLVHSSTRASVRSSGAQSLLPAREASLQALKIPCARARLLSAKMRRALQTAKANAKAKAKYATEIILVLPSIHTSSMHIYENGQREMG